MNNRPTDGFLPASRDSLSVWLEEMTIPPLTEAEKKDSENHRNSDQFPDSSRSRKQNPMRCLLPLCLMHGFVIAVGAAADDPTTKTSISRSIRPADAMACASTKSDCWHR